MKHILASFIALSLVASAATGDYLFQKKTGTGYEPTLLTPEAGKVIAWSGGSPINLDIAGTYQPLIATGGLALNKLAQSSATSGQIIAWNGTAWAAATASGGNLTSGPVTSSSGVSAIADGALTIAKTSGLQTALDTKSSELSPLWKPLRRLYTTDITLPPVIRSLTFGDSWAVNADEKLAANFGQFGEIAGTSASCNINATTGNVRSSGFTGSYALGAFDSSYITHSAAGSSIWGGSNGSVRFTTVGSVLVVIYERITGAGIVSVDYETATTGVWTAAGVVGNSYTAAGGTSALPVASQINAASGGSGTSTLAVATFDLGVAQCTRIRVNYVSGGAVNIITAGITNSATNVSTVSTTRQGLVTMQIGIGGAIGRVDYWNTIPQASLNTLLGWLKPDLVFLRDKQEVPTADWITAFESLMGKVSSAYSEDAFIFPGRHPTGDSSETTSAEKDAYLQTYAKTNNHLFIPVIENFPDYATYLASGLGDSIHTGFAGTQIIENVIWSYLKPLYSFTQELSSSRSTGLRQMGNGVSNAGFFTTANSTTGVGQLGIRDAASGSVNLGVLYEVRSIKSDVPVFNYGFSIYNKTNAISFTEVGAARSIYTGGGGTPTRVPGSASGLTNGALQEIYTGNTGLANLSLQSPSGQSVNMMEIRTGATLATGGTLASGYSKLGIPFAALTAYANDAAADADAALPSGGFYTITGSRAVLRKP